MLVASSPLALAEKPSESGILSMNFENDLFYDTDHDYTNGVRIAWLSSANESPDWIVQAARMFPLFSGHGHVRTGYALGQSMYTPKDITQKNPPLNDRPYAGWLYGSIDVIAETDARLDQLGLMVGIVGPSSLAESTQKFIHRVIGVAQPEGWDTQIKNELGIVLIYQRSWRQAVDRKTFAGMSYDITPHAGGALGNVFTYANTGVTLRIGRPPSLDYGPPRIQPSLPGSGFFVPDRDIDWYFFSGIDIRAVARNIFLDGNTFGGGRRIDKEPFVGDLQLGFVVIWQRVRLSYTHVLRTREFKGQSGGDNFGAMSLSASF